MRATISAWFRSAIPLTLALVLGLPACEELEVPAIRVPPVSDGGAPATRRKNDCFNSVLFLVEGDTFTRMSSGAESFDTRGSVQDSTPQGWRPDIEPRAKYQADLDNVRGKYKGFARLYWNDIVVAEVTLDDAFAFGTEPEILAYEDPDGTRVELHVFAHPECPLFTKETVNKEVFTRAEVEALER